MVAVVVGLLAAAPASAAPGDDGLWYYTASGMDDIHQTTRGEGITIAILDSPINPDFPDLVGANLNVHEPSFCAAEEGGPALPATSTAAEANHGTGLATLLIGTGVGVNGQAGIPGITPDITLNYYTTHFKTPESSFVQCQAPADVPLPDDTAARQAIADGADIISFSTSANITTETVIAAYQAGVILVASGGNYSSGVSEQPALTNGVIAVGSITPEIALWENSPRGPGLAVVAPGVSMRVPNLTFDGYMTASGSSLATPFTAGALALAWSQHPDATANQMIQALFRTTGGTTHGLQRDDDAGYGLVSPYQLLQVDPTTFPDDNPMLFDGESRYPTVAEVREAEPTPSATPTPEAPTDTDAQTDDTDDTTSGAPIGLIAGIAGAVAVAVIITVVLIGRRRTGPAVRQDREGS